MNDSQWISVNDRLPFDGQWVLIYIKEHLGCDKYTVGLYSPGCYKNGDWLTMMADLPNIDGSPTATHWMPLPKAPTDE